MLTTSILQNVTFTYYEEPLNIDLRLKLSNISRIAGAVLCAMLATLTNPLSWLGWYVVHRFEFCSAEPTGCSQLLSNRTACLKFFVPIRHLQFPDFCTDIMIAEPTK